MDTSEARRQIVAAERVSHGCSTSARWRGRHTRAHAFQGLQLPHVGGTVLGKSKVSAALNIIDQPRRTKTILTSTNLSKSVALRRLSSIGALPTRSARVFRRFQIAGSPFGGHPRLIDRTYTSAFKFSLISLACLCTESYPRSRSA